MSGRKWLGLVLVISGCNGSHEPSSPEAEAALCDDVDLTHLPFGDPEIRRRDEGEMPAVGALWLCSVPSNGRGASNASDWTNADGTWDLTRKPIVEGSVTWESVFDVTVESSGMRLITGNGLPSTPTGVYPIDPSSVAYRYDRNPSHIEAHDVVLRLPAVPEVAERPSCVPYGATGYSLSGNAFYHAASTLATDASAYEMIDACGGQSDGSFTYHTHHLTQCLLDELDPCTEGHSALMGYVMDGFGIYGPRGDDGRVLTSADLDECHGHTHEIEWDGQRVEMYHYHWTYDFPYNVGCFRGTPVAQRTFDPMR